MIRVMIACDEFFIRAGIRSTVQWNDLNMEIVGEVKDGKEAVEKCKELNPDIVITHFVGPNKGELELCTGLKQIYPNVRIITIINFDQLSYIKQVMQVSIFDYLIKSTMTVDELKRILSCARKEIEEEKAELKAEALFFLKAKLHEGHPILRRYILASTAYSFINKEDIENLLTESHLPLKKGNMVVMVCKIDELKEIKMKYKDNDKGINTCLDTMCGIIKGILVSHCTGNTFYDEQYTIICIMYFNQQKSMSSTYEILQTMASQIMTSLQRNLCIRVTIGFSNIYQGFSTLPQALKEAEKACSLRMFAGSHRTFFVSEIRKKEILYSNYEANLEEVQNAVETLNKTATLKALEHLFLHQLTQTYNHDLVMEISFKVLGILIASTKNLYRGVKKQEDEYKFYDQFMDLETLKHIYCWFSEKFSDAINRKSMIRDGDYSLQVKKAVKYIMDNYTNNFSLNDVAKSLGVTQNYLGNIFKRDTGMSFNEYLMHWRIRQAQALLKVDSLKVYDVANKVGIHDQRYFSKIFKRVTRLTPNEFRKQLCS